MHIHLSIPPDIHKYTACMHIYMYRQIHTHTCMRAYLLVFEGPHLIKHLTRRSERNPFRARPGTSRRAVILAAPLQMRTATIFCLFLLLYWSA